MKKCKTQVKGVTLIALVVTIIVLLILAAVAISLTIGNNGLFTRAGDAVNTWRKAEANEQKEMSDFESLYDETVNNLGLNNKEKEVIEIEKYRLLCSINPQEPSSNSIDTMVLNINSIDIFEAVGKAFRQDYTDEDIIAIVSRF